jgi:membrane protease YdiL (CAAX protease family)
MPVVLVVEYLTMQLLGMPLPTPSIDWLMAPVLFALFFAAAALEEITWTGVLLEPLVRTHGALLAAVIIGSSWALLHVVPYVQAGNTAYWVLGQCLFSIAFRVVLVCLYQVSGGALFLVVLCHAAYNTAWQLFPNQGSAYDPIIAAMLTTIVAVIAVWVFGARTLAGRHLTRASN